MKFVQLVPLLLALALCLAGGVAHAKADTVALYTEAVMTGDVAACQNAGCPTTGTFSSNGHIQGQRSTSSPASKNKELVVDRLTAHPTCADTKVGNHQDAYMANGYFKGYGRAASPQGLMLLHHGAGQQ